MIIYLIYLAQKHKVLSADYSSYSAHIMSALIPIILLLKILKFIIGVKETTKLIS